MPADNPVIGTLTMADLSRLRKMSHTDGEAFLGQHTIPEDQVPVVKALIGKDKAIASTKGQYDSSRRLWFLSAWLAGASWRKLARLHDVTPQTIMVQVDRQATSEERQRLRITDAPMSLERLEYLRALFIKNEDELMQKTPTEVATWFLQQEED